MRVGSIKQLTEEEARSPQKPWLPEGYVALKARIEELETAVALLAEAVARLIEQAPQKTTLQKVFSSE